MRCVILMSLLVLTGTALAHNESTPRDSRPEQGRATTVHVSLTKNTDASAEGGKAWQVDETLKATIGQGHPSTQPIKAYVDKPYQSVCHKTEHDDGTSTKKCETQFYQEGVAGTLHLFEDTTGNIRGFIDLVATESKGEESLTFKDQTVQLARRDITTWRGVINEGRNTLDMGAYKAVVTVEVAR